MEMLTAFLTRTARKLATRSSESDKRDDLSVEEPKIGQDKIFDSLARTLGNQMPRRQVLRLTVAGVVGAALAEIGLRTAWAAPGCLCNGQVYDPATACCTPSGVQKKHPITNLSACPNKVDHPGYVCRPNGCGAQGGQQFPGSFGSADFLTCCGAPGTSGAGSHDCCWGKCNNGRRACDDAFLTCLQNACQTAYPGSGILDFIKRNSCRAAALGYFAGVESPIIGTRAYEAAQSGGCDCCGTEPCPQECAGGTCTSLPSCGESGCVCFQTVEGTGFCHRSQACAGLQPCSSSLQCPQGWACVSVTCCGSQSICIRPCTVIGPASPISGPTTTSKGRSVKPEGMLTIEQRDVKTPAVP
jgi:hypothetical protein